MPAHFERCLITGEREPLYDNDEGVRASDQSPVNLEISRILGLAGGNLSKYRFPASPTPTRIDGASDSAAESGAPTKPGSSSDEPQRQLPPVVPLSPEASQAVTPTGKRPSGPGATASPQDAGAPVASDRERASSVNALEEDMIFNMSEFEG